MRSIRSKQRRLVFSTLCLAGLCALVIVLLSGTVSLAGPGWGDNGVVICGAAHEQDTPVVTPAGPDASILTWLDARGTSGTSNYQIYAQKVNNTSGEPQWTKDGILVSNKTTTKDFLVEPRSFAATGNGTGGVIITWAGKDSSGGNSGIYVQVIDSSGVLLCGLDGMKVGGAGRSVGAPAIAPTPDGGAIVTWMDNRNGDVPRIYAQKVKSNGKPVWEDPGQPWVFTGLPVCVTPSVQRYPSAVPDGNGGAIIFWYDIRPWPPNPPYKAKIFTQRIDSSGSPVWSPEGIGVSDCYTYLEFPSEFQAISDGAGGAILSYVGQAWKMDSNGKYSWGPGGVTFCSIDRSPSIHRIVASGGGAIIAWEQHGTDYFGDIYAQKLGPDGANLWNSEGVVIANGYPFQMNPHLVADGSGGAVVTWDESQGIYPDNDYFNVMASQVSTDGRRLPTVVVSNLRGDKWLGEIASDGRKGAIFAWTYPRFGSERDNYEIYAQHFAYNPCGAGSGSALLLFGVLMGFLTIAGSGGALARWRRKS